VTLPYVYTYSSASGVEKRRVERVTDEAVTVVAGISGEIVRRTELDAPAARYFTDPFLAIKAFLAKAEVALSDATRRQHHAGWRCARADAQKCLEGLSMTNKDKQWQERYSITSRTGKIWTRSEVLKRAIDTAHGLLMREHSRAVIRAAVEPVLDDEAFMRPRTGMVPARVVEDAAFEAFYKLAPKQAVKP
jgi:hypothetical protein